MPNPDLPLQTVIRPERLHEATGEAALAMTLFVAAGLARRVVLIAEPRTIGALDPSGLRDLIDPGRLLVVRPRQRQDALWGIETSLRSGAAGVVIGVLGRGPDLTESRRMMLAAEAGGATALLAVGRPQSACAAETRWRAFFRPVETFESSRIACELYRNKRGTNGAVYDVECARVQGAGDLAAPPAARPAGPGGSARR